MIWLTSNARRSPVATNAFQVRVARRVARAQLLGETRAGLFEEALLAQQGMTVARRAAWGVLIVLLLLIPDDAHVPRAVRAALLVAGELDGRCLVVGEQSPFEAHGIEQEQVEIELQWPLRRHRQRHRKVAGHFVVV